MTFAEGSAVHAMRGVEVAVVAVLFIHDPVRLYGDRVAELQRHLNQGFTIAHVTATSEGSVDTLYYTLLRETAR